MYERENAAPEAVRLDSAHKEVAWPPAPLESTHDAATAYGHYGPVVPHQQQQQQQEQSNPHYPLDGAGSPLSYPSRAAYAPSEGKPFPPPHEKVGSSKGTVCGLSQRNFMVLFLVALVILGAAIGGGVGGGLAARNTSSDSGSQTPSLASSSSSASPSSGQTSSPSASASAVRLEDVVVPLACPALDGTRERFDARSTFVYRCGQDVAGSAHDIVFLASYALGDCVRACTSYNKNRNSNECTAVQFNADMKACALKNVTNDAPSSVSPANRRVLAMLEL